MHTTAGMSPSIFSLLLELIQHIS